MGHCIYRLVQIIFQERALEMELFKTFNIFSQTALQQDNGNRYVLIHKCQFQVTHVRTEDHS